MSKTALEWSCLKIKRDDPGDGDGDGGDGGDGWIGRSAYKGGAVG
jgi:hypothetical protein